MKHKSGWRFRFTRRYFILVVIFLLSFLGVFKISVASKWDGERRFTIVVNSDPLVVFSIEPRTRQAVLITFPTNTLLEVPYGYDIYPAISIYRLGSLDPKRGAGLLLTKSIEKTFGIPAEGYFAAKAGLLSFPAISELERFKKAHFSISGSVLSLTKIVAVGRQMETNLFFLDILRLWNAIRTIRTDQVAVLELEKSNVLTEAKLPDGTLVNNLDKDLLDVVVAGRFQDQSIRSQSATIEVVNATKMEKLATQFSRILLNLGANVIMKTTAEREENFVCLIFISKKKFQDSFIVKRLRTLYQCRLNPEMGSDVDQSDIKIVLGEEFIK